MTDVRLALELILDALNPILASYAAKGILPYHGIGSGIKRALQDWPDIRFADDREGCLFTATVQRKEVKSSPKSSLKTPVKSSPKSSLKTPAKSSVKSSVKTDAEILEILSQNPYATISELASTLELTTRGVEKQIATLKKAGRLRRIGPDKGGHWEVKVMI